MNDDKPLEFIQNIINRMANNSFILKGWSVTLVAGIIGFSLTNSVTVAYLAFLPALIFWGLDAYYLRQERLYRELYNHAISNPKKLKSFSLNTDSLKNEVDSWFYTLFSKTVFCLHGTLITVIAIMAIFGGNGLW